MRQRKPSYYVQGKAVFLYQGEIKKSIYRFKYSNRREYAAFFAEEAHRRFGDWIKACGIQAIVPVPMYRRKERRRGYNQAKLLAKELAALTGLCYEPNAVRRIRDTRPQKELNDTERQNNLKTAFQAQDFVVKYKKILLVDDIYTTGCTAETVAEELFQTGVEQVYFLSVCIGKGF
jgi:ComF family protein